MSSGKHDWDSKFDMTYRQGFLWKFTDWVYLIREMEKELGKEKAHDIIRKVRDQVNTDRYKKLFKERKSVDSFQEYLVYSRESRKSPMMSKTRSTSNHDENSEELTYLVDECLWAMTFKELGAEDIGELLCEGASHQVSCVSPHLRFNRTMTLMKGDPYCNYRYTWEEE